MVVKEMKVILAGNQPFLINDELGGALGLKRALGICLGTDPFK
jgi:hypothetical protein